MILAVMKAGRLSTASDSGAAVTVEAQRIFNAVGDREGEADALRMQVGLGRWATGR